MADKNKYILTVSNRTALARNKRLREAGASVYINGSTVTQAGTSGIDEKGVVDVQVQGSGNAVTDAKLNSDGSTIVLNKGKTFLDNDTAEGKFIRKDQDDGTDYSLYVNTDFDVKGTTTVQTLQVNGNATMAQLLDVIGKLTARGGVQFGSSFESGLLGEGGYFDNKGYGEMRGLTLWEWLEVPELRYNRVTVNTGITWQTFGGGIIESVEVTGENTGIITLKLEDGEIGTVAQDDLCMGIYHDFEGGNDEEDVDEHNGNFHFSGFKTIYFRVVEVLDTDTNGKFSYVLRESQQGHWTEQNHPCEFMHFASYANPNNTDRQNCHYSTTKYLISLQNMTDWEYGNNNIYYIRGILEGFTVGDTELHGNGIYIGNGYFSGILQQIENAPYTLNIEYTEGDTLLEEGESAKITCTVTKGWQDMTVTKWQVKRETGDTEADEKWNEAHTDFDGTIEVTYDDLFTDEITSALLRFTATMEDGTEVSNSTILHSYVSGEDGLSIIPTASNIVLSEGQVLDDWSLEVRAYRGGEQIALTRDMVSVNSTISGASVAYTSTNGVIQFGITRETATTEVDGSFYYTITIDGVAYTFTCGVKSVFNGEKGDKGDTGAQGEKGDKGDDGEPAIYYELELSCETLEYNAFADAFAPSTITIQVVKVEGTERSYVSFSGSINIGGFMTFIILSKVTSYTYTPNAMEKTLQGATNYMEYVAIQVRPDENTAVTLTHTIYPTTSYMPRVRYWEDVATGGQFCQGKLGEQYRDIVIHPKNSNNYFYCQESHYKSTSNEPQAGTTTEYWKPISYFEMIATNLLLADVAKIYNLYVDDVFMVGYDSAIWLNPNHEGMKIVKATDLTSTDRSSQFEEEAWNNPTAYFHANDIPDPATYYGGDRLQQSVNVSSRSYTNNTGGAKSDVDETLATTSTIITLPAGRKMAITISGLEVSCTEGSDVEGESLHLDGSIANFAIRVNIGSKSYNVWSATMEFGANQSGETNTYKVSDFTVYRTSTDTSAQPVTLTFLVYGQFKNGTAFTMSSLQATVVADPTEGYVSQYGANGILIGQNSNTYFRVKVDESDPQYQMLAGGTGIDITQQGSMQVVGGNQMPLGGLLLNGYISSSTQFFYWTFDGSTLAFSHTATGTYTIKLPSSWSSLFGGYYAAQSSVQATLVNLVGYVRVSQDSESGYWGVINMYTYNASGTLTDSHFYVSLHYASGYNTITYNALQSNSTDAEIINE